MMLVQGNEKRDRLQMSKVSKRKICKPRVMGVRPLHGSYCRDCWAGDRTGKVQSLDTLFPVYHTDTHHRCYKVGTSHGMSRDSDEISGR